MTASATAAADTAPAATVATAVPLTLTTTPAAASASLPRQAEQHRQHGRHGQHKVHTMSDLIAHLLLTGVGISAAVLVAGLGAVLVTGRTGYHERLAPALILSPQGSVAFPESIGDALRGARALKPFAIIEVGTLLLIATPVFRVAASAILFWTERDRTYAVLTMIVLVLLLVSIFRIG